MWSIPLGWQLSALYTLLLAITLAVVGLLVYTQQQDFLVQDAATRLELAATRILVRDISTAPGGPGHSQPPTQHDEEIDHGDPGGGTSPQSRPVSDNDIIRGLSGTDVTVALLDTTGKIITTTQDVVSTGQAVIDPVSNEHLTAALTSGQSVHWIAQRADGSRRVVVLMKISALALPGQNAPAGGQQVQLLEQSASLGAADAAIQRLGSYLLLGIIGGTIAGLVLGIAFTRRLLRPLDRVVDTAEAISAGDLQRRLQLPAGRNEVARLGTAFDTMVGRLVATLEAQRRFVADASHELRTPLTSLKGLAEILMIGAHGNNPQVIEQSAGAINGELERLIRLVTDLLTLSRLDSTGSQGGAPIRRAPVDVCATVEAVAAQMGLLAEARDVRLSHGCEGSVRVMGDAGQLKQVILNLVDNALRHTPAGGEVELRSRVDAAFARIEVVDTGSGIAERDLPHIFERFYRGDASRTRATGNSGLGLAIARTIVEAHQGTISVESTLGMGTRFTIKLPLARIVPSE